MPRPARQFFAFCLLPFALLKAQERQFPFEKVRAVFVQPGTTGLATDEHGRLWFGIGGRGLFCYDGYSSQQWQYDANDTASLGSDRLNGVCADRRQGIWAATRLGLNRLDRRTGLVRRWMSLGDTTYQFRAVFEDRAGQVWVTGDPASPDLYRFDEASGRFFGVPPGRGQKPVQLARFADDAAGQLWAVGGDQLFTIQKEGYEPRPFFLKKGEKTGRLNALRHHSDGKTWLAADGGVFVFDPKSGRAERAELPDSLALWPCADLLFAEDGQLWLALRGRGLACWDPLTGAHRRFRHRPGDERSQLFFDINQLLADAAGNLWFAGAQYDIGRINLRPSPLSLWQVRPTEGREQRVNTIYRMGEDRLGQLLIATTQQTYLIKKWGDPARPIPLDPLDPRSRIPWEFVRERGGRLWAVGNALLEWVPEKERFERRFEKETAPLGALLNLEQDFEDEAVLWLGTSKGLARLDRSTGRAELLEKVALPQFGAALHLVVDDGAGRLWLKLPGCLGIFDKQTGLTEHIFSHSPPPRRLTNNEVLDINRSPDGQIWVSTIGGINRIDPRSGRWESITRREGLPDNVVNATSFDAAGNAWANLPEQLVRFDRATGGLQIFDKTTSLQSGSWTRGRLTLSDGRLLVPSLFGIIEVRPEEVQLVGNEQVAPVVLTNFEVGGAAFGARRGAFEFLQNVQLAAGQNDLAFEWAGIRPERSRGLQYEYRLDGLHEHWVAAGSERRAVFANLAPGAYRLRVRTTGAAGTAEREGGGELAFRFIIAPPWHQTAWFRMLAGLMAVVAAFLFYKNRESQRLLRQQKELAEQNDRYKTRFLTNVSHEIRTPMNAIVGLSRLLTEAGLPGKASDYAEAIRQSSENLLVLINDVLDQAKIESGKFTFQSRPFDLALIIRHLQNTLGIRAAEKGLLFETVFENEVPLQLIGDPVRLTQILTNLLGNAIKFTERGSVRLGVELVELGELGARPNSTNPPNSTSSTKTLLFKITDTGIGIAPDRVERVFESFQQADDDISATYGGTGLGLSITKQLVEQQGGRIWLESAVGHGSAFFVELPFGVGEGAKTVENQPVAPGFAFGKLRILLVEDTFFNQMLATELLESRLPGVEIEVAENGVVALEKLMASAIDRPVINHPSPVINNQFDLILMDVKMPVMDGLEATRRIRKLPDGAVSSLPIIGLTANAVAEELEKCRAAGMDAWVTKPIEAEEFFGTMARVLADFSKRKKGDAP